MNDGVKQVSDYARLSDRKPDALAGYKIGDLVMVESLGRCRIVALHPPSLIELQTAGGGRCRVGWRTLRRIAG